MPTPESIGIWGIGREGRAATEFFARERPGADVTLLTDSEAEPRPDWAGDAAFLAGDAARRAIGAGRFALLVKSPGISLYRPEVAQARAQGTRVTSGMNLWFEHYRPRNVVAVSGTKGKSTCSAMLFALLRAGGSDMRLLGNGGTPTLGQAPGKDATILEVSSYQAADLDHAPDMAVLTSLYPEHAPWHGSAEQYFADKLRLVTLDRSVPVIANGADKRLRNLLDGRDGVIWSGEPPHYTVEDNGLRLGGHPVAVLGPVPKGAHNLGNLALAATAARALGRLPDPLTLDLRGFSPLPHRLQEFDLGAGVLAVDDSISTIPEATLAALGAYAGRPIHLILGGDDRGQDYGALAAHLEAHPLRTLCLLPSSGHRIEGADRLAEIAVRCGGLAEAVAAIAPRARADDVILLSPAAPSHNQYRNFAERGDHFVELCRAALGARERA